MDTKVLLKIQDLHKNFGDHEVLKGINIEIKKGEMPNKPTKNFNVLSKYNMEIKPGLVVDCCDKIRPINDKAYTFPVYLLGA